METFEDNFRRYVSVTLKSINAQIFEHNLCDPTRQTQ